MRSEDEVRVELIFWSGYVDGLSKTGKKEASFAVAEAKRDILRWVLGEDVANVGLATKVMKGEKL